MHVILINKSSLAAAGFIFSQVAKMAIFPFQNEIPLKGVSSVLCWTFQYFNIYKTQYKASACANGNEGCYSSLYLQSN